MTRQLTATFAVALVLVVALVVKADQSPDQKRKDAFVKKIIDAAHTWSNTTGAPETNRTTYDWGQHTSTQGPNQNTTGAPDNGTTYDWGQHTGSTYDWGQHTSTQSPNQNSTGGGQTNGTTYDWGQHTGSTFDWGKYTSTKAPQQNSTTTSSAESTRTTYNWGQHTGSTYDWGQHTKPTQAPNHNNTDNNGNNTDNNHENSRCGAGSYSCSGAIGLCLTLKQVCDGQIDCPHADDEEPRICHSAVLPPANKNRAANLNRFRGQGFMFAIRNVKVGGGSHVKLFNQDSDRRVVKSG